MLINRLASQLKEKIKGNLTQGILWNLGSVVILGIGGLVINLIIISLRGEVALGVFNQVYSVFMLTSQIGIGGIHFSVLKQVSYHQDDRDRCGDITTSGFLLALILLTITCLILWQLADDIGAVLQSTDVEQGIQFVVPGILFIGLNRVLNNTVNGLAMMRAYAIIQSLRFIITPIVVLLLAISTLPTPYLLWCFSISEFVLLCILAWYVYGQLVPLRRIHDFSIHFREHLSYGARGFLSGVVGTLNTRIDVIMLGYFASDQVVGIYSIASTIMEGFVKIPVAFRWNVDPLLGKYFSQKDDNALYKLFARMRRIIYPSMATLALIAIFLYPLALSLFTNWDVVLGSWYVFIILSFGVVLNSYYRVFKGILLQGNKPGYFTLTILLAIISNVLLNAVLIPQYGLNGAALATTLTYVIESLLLAYMVRKTMNLKL